MFVRTGLDVFAVRGGSSFGLLKLDNVNRLITYQLRNTLATLTKSFFLAVISGDLVTHYDC